MGNGIKVQRMKFDTSSSTSTGWYMGQGTIVRARHLNEGMQII